MAAVFKSKDYIYLLILLIISILLHHEWSLKLDILASGDVIYFFKESCLDYFNIPSIWTSNDQFGAPFIAFATFPIYFLYGLFAYLGLEYSVSLRLLFCYVITVAPVCFMYIFIKNLTKSSVAAVVGSISFSYSIYFLFLQSVHLNLAAAISLVPLEFYLFTEGLWTKSYRIICFASVLCFIMGVYDFRISYIVIILLFIYLCVFTLLGTAHFATGILFLRLFFIFIILIISYNLYWIMPLLYSNKLTNNAYFNRGLFGNEFFDIMTALTSFHPFWTGGIPSVFVAQPIPTYLWLLPILSFTSLLILRKNANVFYFALIALIGIILTKQSGYPIPGFYSWLYYHFPGFSAFREASKFYLLTVISYSALIGYTLLVVKDSVKRYNKIIFLSLVSLMLIIFCYNTLPILTGSIKNVFEPKTIYEDYDSIRNQLVHDDEYYRTFWIPHSSRFSFFSNLHPKIEAFDVIQNDWTFLLEQDRNKSHISIIESLLHSEYSDFLFDSASIRYVCLPYDNYNEIYATYSGKMVDYSKILNGTTWLKFSQKNMKHTYIYENKNYYPKIYIPQQTFILEKDKGILNALLKNYTGKSRIAIVFKEDALKSSLINSTHFKSSKIELNNNHSMPFAAIRSNATIAIFKNTSPAPYLNISSGSNFEYNLQMLTPKDPFILILNENYDTNWKLFIMNASHDASTCELIEIIRILFFKSVPNENHILANGYANAWYVDPRNLSVNNYMTMKLFYMPESVAIIGISLSGCILMLTMLYLIYPFRKYLALRYFRWLT